MLYNLFENRDFISAFAVALLAEGVDRNFAGLPIILCTMVALLAEGVDRNSLLPEKEYGNVSRPPRGGRG